MYEDQVKKVKKKKPLVSPQELTDEPKVAKRPNDVVKEEKSDSTDVVKEAEVASSVPKLTVAEQRLQHHLGVIQTFQPITVENFQKYTDLGNAAKTILSQYLSQGLVERRWERASGRYSLTDLGAKTLSGLDGKQ